MTDYDVVVVGGGPAGLWFAKRAAERDVKVLVLERKKEIGTPVQCAEGFGLGGMKKLGIEPDARWSGWNVHGAKLYAPNGKFVYVPGEGFVIERKIFEKELAKIATRAGARVLAFHEVTDIIKENGEIVGVRARFLGEEREFYANIVVAADGFESRIARLAGLNTTQIAYHVDSGFEYQMAGLEIDADNIHLFFGKSIAPRGYIWIFPTDKDAANVGIGIDARSPVSAREYLERWMRAHPEYGFDGATILEVRGGGVPVGGLMRDLTMDHFMVVGDAAHQVHPLHGGGMFLAMEAAEVAADVAAKAVELGDFSNAVLSEYSRRWWSMRGEQLEKLVKVRQVLERLEDEDFNKLAEIFSHEDILAFSEGKLSALKRILPKLVKYPRLVEILRPLIF